MTRFPNTPKANISIDELNNIASLARLHLDLDQYGDLSREFAAILGYVDILDSVDTDAVKPLYSPVIHTSPMREDLTCDSLSRQDLFANAPKSDGEFFIVPKIV